LGFSKPARSSHPKKAIAEIPVIRKKREVGDESAPALLATYIPIKIKTKKKVAENFGFDVFMTAHLGPNKRKLSRVCNSVVWCR